MRWLLAVALCLGGIGAQAAPRCGEPLRIGVIAAPLGPFLLGEGDELAEPPGLMILWMRKTLRDLGCDAVWRRLPPARLQQSLAQDEVDIALALSASPEREKLLAYPRKSDGSLDDRLAIAEARMLLYVLEERAASVGWRGDGSWAPPSVGAARASAAAALARSRQWQVVETPSSPQGIAMLRGRRFDVMLAPDLLVDRDELGRPPAVVALHPPVQSQLYHAPVSAAFLARRRELAQAIWVGLCEASREHFKSLPKCAAPR